MIHLAESRRAMESRYCVMNGSDKADSTKVADGTVVQISFNFSGTQKVPISIQRSTDADYIRRSVHVVSETARATNTSYEYSGRHDHGDLPELKAEGATAALVVALKEGKAACDAFLTDCINKEYGCGGNSSETQDAAKPTVDADDCNDS